MQTGFTLADLWHSRPIHHAARLRVRMRLDRRSEEWSIARPRAEVLAGQTDRSGAKTAMTLAEALEMARIHSVAGLTGDRTALITTRPCRAPHQTISDAGLIGGGHVPLPGEVSLAHNSVLFLDARPECSRQVLEVLRQPLEDGVIYL